MNGIHPNDIVLLKPTTSGWGEIELFIRRADDYMRRAFPRIKHRLSVPEADDDGYISGEFWYLMQMFNWGTNRGDIPFTDLHVRGENND